MKRIQMQLRLNFDQRMMYNQTNKSVNAGGASPKREIEVALMMIGIQGYPAQVMIETYSK